MTGSDHAPELDHTPALAHTPGLAPAAGLNYLPAREGGWLALVDGPRMLLLSPSGWNLQHDGREAIGSAGGFEVCIDLLTRSGFSSIPDFLLVENTGTSLRTLLRGPVTLTVSDAAGSHTYDGTGISTWTERTFGDVTAATSIISGADPVPDAGYLPLSVGSALVAELRYGGVIPRVQVQSSREDARPHEDPHPSEVTVSSPLEGETVIRPTQPIAAAPAQREPAVVVHPIGPTPADGPAARPGDHDGNTIMSSDLPKSRTRPSRPESPRSAAPVPPALVLQLSTGSREPLDAPLIVGRAPTVSQVSGDRMPRLVTIGGGDHDISRNHARVSVEGGTVVVTDLHSRNGTLVVLPGKSPQKLRAGEPTAVIVGTLVDLGGGITLTVGEE